MKGLNGGTVRAKEQEEEQEEGMSAHSPCKKSPSSSSSLHKEQSQVEVELKLLEALEIYPLVKLRGTHHHFVLFGLTDYLQRSFNRPFSPSEVLQLLDRFYNLEMLCITPEFLNHNHNLVRKKQTSVGREVYHTGINN